MHAWEWSGVRKSANLIDYNLVSPLIAPQMPTLYIYANGLSFLVKKATLAGR